jgi:hypothetical protein
MSKLATIVTLAGLITVTPALSQTAVPDLRGTWKGEKRDDNSRHGECSSWLNFIASAATQQRPVHAYNRQAGRPAFLRHALIFARH